MYNKVTADDDRIVSCRRQTIIFTRIPVYTYVYIYII